jgi:hypothetical protein
MKCPHIRKKGNAIYQTIEGPFGTAPSPNFTLRSQLPRSAAKHLKCNWILVGS